MESIKTLAFTGLRSHKLPFGFDEQNPVCLALKAAIYKQLRCLIETENVLHFISGMALGSDQICAEIVLSLKEQYGNIALEAAIPYKDQDASWPEQYRARYRNLISNCDIIHVVSDCYTDDCLKRRNNYMVDKCGILLAVWNGAHGGTANTVMYARQQDKKIIVIDPTSLS